MLKFKFIILFFFTILYSCNIDIERSKAFKLDNEEIAIKKYSATKEKVTLEYPSTWEIRSGNEIIFFIVQNNDSTEEGDFRTSISVSQLSNEPLSKSSFDDGVNEVYTNLQSIDKLINKKYINLNGYEAVKISTYFFKDGNHLKSEMYYI